MLEVVIFEFKAHQRVYPAKFSLEGLYPTLYMIKALIMSYMQIRPARPEDATDFFDVRCSVKENYMSPAELATIGITPEVIGEMIAGGDNIAPVVIVDDKIAGMAMAHISEGYVFALFIRPEYEGRGLGRALMQVVESGLVEHGVTDVWLCTGSEEGSADI